MIVADFHHTHHLDYLDRNWNEIMPYILHYNEAVNPDLQDSVSEKIRAHFFHGKPVNKETYPSLVEVKYFQ